METNTTGRVVYSSERTLVARVLVGPQQTVIRKEFVGADSRLRFRRELAALRRLDGLAGVPRLLQAHPDDGVLLLEDLGDRHLAVDAGATMDPAELQLVGADLAQILVEIHRRNLLHLDVNPRNILHTGNGPALIDFDLAVTVDDGAPGHAGTPPYMAPEQTGRTGHGVDERTDLYGLGATLYELATGRPPFDGGDSLQLLRDQLAGTPRPAADANPGLPPRLGDIIDRLLAKDPNLRYQSAEGLACDLLLPLSDDTPLGRHDFSARLRPPTRLVGREAASRRLQAAFDGALDSGIDGAPDGGIEGRTRGVMVAGAAGIGKTSLIDTLRPIVAAAGGWFVTGKFDQYRRDRSGDAVAIALRALSQLIIAEPPAQLDDVRTRLDEGAVDARLVVGVAPDLGPVLDRRPDDTEPALERLVQAAAGLLRAVVSPARPLVVVLDDLQWISALGIGLLDEVFLGRRIEGLLVVGSYRDAEIDPTHPVFDLLAKWRTADAMPETVTLSNLSGVGMAELIGEMLRITPEEATPLADAVAGLTDGNPFGTIELVNGLRRDSILVQGLDGWTFDLPAVRTYVGDHDVAGVLTGRIAALPPRTRQILTVMALLGGSIGLQLLRTALARPNDEIWRRLGPALDEGLIVLEVATTTAVFRHDRVQQAAHQRLAGRARSLVLRVLGGRLAAEGSATVAAQLLLQALPDLHADPNRARWSDLFRRAAAELRTVDAALAERYLAAAVDLAGPRHDPELDVERHRLLVTLGRHDEADAVFDLLRDDRHRRAAAAPAQVTSLTLRADLQRALQLGLETLLTLGVDLPADRDAATETGLDRLFSWIARESVAADLRRPPDADPSARAAANLLLRMMPAAFFSDLGLMVWLLTVAQQLWERGGPQPALVGSLGHTGIVGILTRGEYRASYDVVRHVTAVADHHGWPGEGGLGRFLDAVSTAHWFQPIEEAVRLGRQAREELLRAGDLQFAGATYHATVPTSIDCAATLDDYAEEVASSVAFATRIGNEQAAATLYTYRRLVGLLRGEPVAEGFDGAAFAADRDSNPMAVTYFHVTSGLHAAITGDRPALVGHADAAFRGLPSIAGSYSTSTVHLLRALASADPADRTASRDWLAARAADAPVNFEHLVAFCDAERLRTEGAFADAVAAYETALRLLAGHRRPWQRALITERYARLLLDAGHAVAGRHLLADARRAYENWGAVAKVRMLDAGSPDLRPPPTGTAPTTAVVDGHGVDVMALLAASRALSSETTIPGLSGRADEVIGSLTGATHVTILVRHDGSWSCVSRENGDFPASVVRYADRTGRPVLVGDATTDDRFARDPYFAGCSRCSLLAVPISAGKIDRAMLVVENRLSTGAFTEERLDVVKLVAGQLAVSLANIRLFSELERRVGERTTELAEANRRLRELSRTDGLTGLANRRELDRCLELAWQEATAGHLPLSLAMIDVDHFKLYNDLYGHPAGDEVLRRLAGVLRYGLRQTDLVARYGGEEFALVLPGAGPPDALRIAQRAVAACRRLDIPHLGHPAGHVTISVGVAGLDPTRPMDVAALVAAADAQLYEAKARGRDTVAS